MRRHGAPEQIIEGEIIEADPPRKLVQTYRMLFSPELAGEPFTRLTYEIEEEPYGGVTRLTVTHDVTGAPPTRPRSRERSAKRAAAGVSCSAT